jgi:hypothetical protein
MAMGMELAASQLIKLYMQKEIIMGNIYYAPTPEARLLDALNGLTDRGPIKKGRFLELSNVTIQHLDGKMEKMNRTYINKATVQVAVTMGDTNAGRGLGGMTGPKSYPYVEKLPLSVLIETHDYLINGNMYKTSYQAIWHILEDTLTFLPITHAQITTVATDTQELFPFIAVNKEHILSLQESNGKHKNSGVKTAAIKKTNSAS